MARRRLTLKRIDPWSVLKFGFVANLALLAIWLLGAGIIWFFVRQLELIEKVCEIAGDVGFVECGVNGGNLFRALLLLGLLGTVIQTGLIVFLAFLHNLIADLVGGVSFTYTEEGGTGSVTSSSGAVTASRSGSPQADKQPVSAGSRSGSSVGSSSTSASSSSGSSPGGSQPAGGWSGGGTTSGQGSGPSSSSGGSPRETSQGSSQPSQGPGQGGGQGAGPGSSQPSQGPGQGSAQGSEGGAAGSGPPSSGSSSSASGDWDLFGPRGSGGSGG